MEELLEQEIKRLEAHFLSDDDPMGRGFLPLADAFRRAGEFDRARELLNEGLVAHPGFSSGHLVSGWVHREQGEMEAAISDFRKVLELDPTNVSALRGVAEVEEERGNHESALEILQILVEIERRDADLAERVNALSTRVAEKAAAVVEDEPPLVEEPVAAEEAPIEAEAVEEEDEVDVLEAVEEEVEAIEPEPEPEAVPVEALAPEVVEVEPEPEPEAEPEAEAVPVEALAPEVVEVEPEPEAVSIESLAPDAVAALVDEPAAELEAIEPEPEPEPEPEAEAVPVEALAPEVVEVEPEPEAVSIESLAPDAVEVEPEAEAVPVEALAPEVVEVEPEPEAVSIESLAPDAAETFVDESSSDSLIVEAFGAVVDAFELGEDSLRVADGFNLPEREFADTSEIGVEEPVAADEPLPEDAPSESFPDPVQDLADGLGAEPPEEVVTRTMAEVYARQGLYERAIEVYDRLIEAAPEDETLVSRWEELLRLAGREQPGEVVAEASPEADVQAEEGDDRDIVSIETLAPDQPDALT